MKTIFLYFGIFVLAIFLTPNAFGDFGDISLTPLKIVSVTGESLETFHIGQQIGVESTLTNHVNSEQKFTYVVQVSNKNGAIEFLEGFSASMVSNQSFTVSQVWIPKISGQYVV